VKKHTGGERFDDVDEMKEEVNDWLEEQAAGNLLCGMPQRLQKCIDRDGDYVIII